MNSVENFQIPDSELQNRDLGNAKRSRLIKARDTTLQTCSSSQIIISLPLFSGFLPLAAIGQLVSGCNVTVIDSTCVAPQLFRLTRRDSSQSVNRAYRTLYASGYPQVRCGWCGGSGDHLMGQGCTATNSI
jgi:hypothetical protein